MKTAFLLMVLVFLITWSCSSAQPMHPDQCWNEFKHAPHGCLESIKGIFHGHLHGIKKECCGTVNTLSDLCWPLIFPSMPYIRFAIKGFCSIKYALHWSVWVFASFDIRKNENDIFINFNNIILLFVKCISHIIMFHYWLNENTIFWTNCRGDEYLQSLGVLIWWKTDLFSLEFPLNFS